MNNNNHKVNCTHCHTDECNHHEHNHQNCETHKCGCDHEHSHSDIKQIVIRIVLGSVLFIGGLVFSGQKYLAPVLYIAAYLILGYDVIINGIKHLFKNHTFSEHLLMSIASLGAFALGQFSEGCAVMLFYQIGELFNDTANEKSEKSIRELINIKPEYANLLINNKIEKVPPEELKAGDIVTVSAGEQIPSDGIIIEGSTSLDTSKMTGEEQYSVVNTGDSVISGCINISNLIKVKITTPYSESGVSKVLKLLDEIDNNKSESEKFITLFAKYYTPTVVIIAAVTGLIVPFFTGFNFSDWIYKALLFLVVSCPCALIISVPLAFFSANGCASKYGILIKGSLASEKLSHIGTVAFDKTGTVTQGSFKLISLRCTGIKSEIFEKLAYAEYYSTHPLSEVITEEYKSLFKKEISADRINDYTEIAGQGISVLVDNERVLAGNIKLMQSYGIDFTPVESEYTAVYIAINGKYAGYAEFSDGIKENAKDCINSLKKMNIKPIMLSGDKEDSVKAVSAIIGINEYYSELLPQDKVEKVEEVQQKSKVAFVGDGINDAPVISLADVGISMGLSGSDAAIAASDVVILSDDISKIPLAINISKRTMRIVWENIIFSIGIKILIMLLGLFGFANLWVAVFGDVGVSVLAVINSLRALKYNKDR